MYSYTYVYVRIYLIYRTYILEISGEARAGEACCQGNERGDTGNLVFGRNGRAARIKHSD